MATIKDLAKHTGFSVTTISRVLNNDPTMKTTDSTRIAILEAAAELNYSLPRSRQSGRGHAVRIAIADMMSRDEVLSDPYYLYLKNYVVRACMEQGYMVSYLSELKNESQISEYGEPDGILAVGVFSEEQISRLREISSNLIFVDSSPDEQRFDSVVMNYKLGVEQALDYLMERGHYRIGFLGPTHKMDQQKRAIPEVRRQFFKDYMEMIGRYDERWMIDTLATPDEIRKQMKNWMRSDSQRPTALLTYNKETAVMAASIFQEAGFSIPGDTSIISFSDTPLPLLIEPPLTSVDVHLEYMGKTAVRLMRGRLAEPTRLPYKVVLPLTLAERSSVADISEEQRQGERGEMFSK